MKKVSLTTPRLVIEPADMETMLDIHKNEANPELKQAYSEMIETMRSLPSREYWGSCWKIMLFDGVCVGTAAFMGAPDKNCCIEIGYGIDEEYRNNGYATEGIGAMISWAFSQPGVKCIQAQTTEDNRASQRVLEKNGMTRVGTGKEGPLFEIRK